MACDKSSFSLPAAVIVYLERNKIKKDQEIKVETHHLKIIVVFAGKVKVSADR